MSVMAIFYWQLLVMAHLPPQHNSPVFEWCVTTLAIALKGQNTSAGVVKVPHSTKFDAEKVKQQLGISVRAWDEHMYEMKQLSHVKSPSRKQQLTLMRCLTIPV
jgi:hypothetical protein